MRRLAAMLFCLLLPLAASAQEGDRGFLTRLIENALSSENQSVRLEGFAGALSSQARFDRLTISDADGVWLTIENAVLDWDRGALLRGRLQVGELSAGSIDLERLPPGNGGGFVLPSPTSTVINLPDLPVAVHIGKIAAGRLRLGPQVLGEEVVATLKGGLDLEGGAGAADIALRRIDGKEGRLTLTASFSNASRHLKIALDLAEAADGVLSHLLQIPDRPALEFTIAGDAPVSDFAADIRLVAAGAPRLTGALRIADLPEGAGLRFGLDLGGNVAALVERRYRPFFGSSATLALAGELRGDGRTLIDRIALKSQELDLDGSLEIAADGLPARFDLRGDLHPTDGRAVLLPLPGTETRIASGTVRATFDAAKGDGFSVETGFSGFDRAGLTIDAARVSATGSIRRGDAAGVLARIVLAVDGMALPDADLAAAIGPALSGSLSLDWLRGQPVRLREVDVTAGQARFAGDAELSGLGDNLRIAAKARLTAGDLAPYSGLAGRALRGAASASVDGWYEPLGGAFDLRLDATTSGLGLGGGPLDALLGGDGSFRGGLARGPQGTRFDDLRVETPQVSAVLAGTIGAADGAVTLDARLQDVAVLYPGLSGPATAKGTLGRDGDTLRFDLTGQGPGAVSLTAKGTAQADLSALAMTVDGGIADISVLVPQFSGPVGAKGQVALKGQALSLDLATDGPEGAALRVAGGYALDSGLADLRVTGNADLALANRLAGGAVDLAGAARLDLRLAGLPGPAALSGTLSAEHARVRLPSAGITLPDADLVVTLDPAKPAGPEALVAARIAAVLRGVEAPGQVWAPLIDGPVTLRSSAVLAKDGALAFDDLVLANGDARITGTAAVSGQGGETVISGNLRLALDTLARLRPLVDLPMAGALSAAISGSFTPASGAIEADVSGQATALRVGSGPAFDLLDGDATFSARLTGAGGDFRVENGRFANGALALDAGYRGGRLQLDLRLDSLGRFVPQLPGPVHLTGTVGLGDGYGVDLDASGPGGIGLRIGGSVSQALVPDLSIEGSAPLGIANAFLNRSVDVQGQVSADLRLRGTLGLAGLAGTLTVSGGRAAVPAVGLALTGLQARVTLAGGQAQVSASTGFSTAGTARIEGSVGLSGGNPVDLALTLSDVVAVKEPTVRTTLNGQMTLSGALATGGRLSGRIDLGETEVSLAFGAAGGTLIDVMHVGESAGVAQTLRRAGLRDEGAQSSAGGGKLQLDLLISAPNRVFVRGRGLDAELGGQLRLAGRAGDIIPIGQFELIRGRLDILGKRLELTEASLALQGSFDPVVHLVAATRAEDVDIQIVTEGYASAPRISLRASPDLPEDQILALLLFGRGLDKISAVQALQLANSIRTLLGPGGEGLQGKIREQFGLDDLDVTTDANGNLALKAGKYLSENVYTDVTVNADGEAEIELNLDITPNLTARGKAGSSGNTSLGIFFEKDY